MGQHLRAYLNKPEAAEQYYRELIDGYKFNNLYKQRAWGELSYIALARKDFPKAEAAVQRALDLSQDIESPVDLCLTYDLLGEVYWLQKQIQRATEAKIQAWRYARQWRNQAQLYKIYVHLTEIRLYQAQQDPLRYIPKAQRWLRWAASLAERLDQQKGTNKYQQAIQKTQAECEQVLALWSRASQVTKQNRAYDYQGNKQISR